MENNEMKKRRVIHLLPNLITSSSMFAAFLAIIFSGNGEGKFIALAAVMIFVSAIMDGLDGKVARLTGTASEFGVQFDSLADCIAFGVTPAIVAYNWHLHDFGRFGIAVAFLFIICAALRLARFNVNVSSTSKKFFVGLPSPAAGCSVAALVLFSPLLPNTWQFAVPYLCIFISICVPILMVSRVRYYAFKELTFFRLRPFRSLVGIILVCGLIFSSPNLFLFIFLACYILSGPFYTFFWQPKRHERILRRLNKIAQKINPKKNNNVSN